MPDEQAQPVRPQRGGTQPFPVELKDTNNVDLIGQKTMANSIPVVLPSDHTTPVSLSGLGFSLRKNWHVTSTALAVNAPYVAEISPVVPNGKILDLFDLNVSWQRLITVNSNNTPRVQLVWDAGGSPITILDTYMERARQIAINTRIIGNGTKILRLTITNGGQNAQVFITRLNYQEL